MSDLLVYTCHQTFEEVSYRPKYHFINANVNEGKALCGFSHNQFAGVMASEVNREWFETNKSCNDEICQHCKKKALKILNNFC